MSITVLPRCGKVIQFSLTAPPPPPPHSLSLSLSLCDSLDFRLVLPFLQSYVTAAQFTIRGKLYQMVKENAIWYGSFGIIFGVLFIYVAATGSLDRYETSWVVVCGQCCVGMKMRLTLVTDVITCYGCECNNLPTPVDTLSIVSYVITMLNVSVNSCSAFVFAQRVCKQCCIFVTVTIHVDLQHVYSLQCRHQ